MQQHKENCYYRYYFIIFIALQLKKQQKMTS